MSWFARSISNTLNFDEPEEHDLDEINKHSTAVEQIGDEQQPDSPGRGVKEDLSELTKTLSRQFWGVASFLAPPPPSDSNPHEPSDAVSDPDSSEPEAISGIRNDFAEIGGRFRSGISKLSSNIAVSEITKMASTFLQLGPEEGDYDAARGAVGVTDEVVAFVRDIAMHPERWLDFPLSEDEDDEDFDLSDVQQEHALAVERLAPQLAALRIELCPGYMSEGSFWKIYFVLLHPKLDSHDAELLLTHEIVKARASLTHELQNSQAYPEQDGLKRDTSYLKEMSAPREESLFVPSNVQSESLGLADPTLSSAKSTLPADGETDKHPILSNEIQIIDKSVIEERLKNQPKDQSASSSNVSEPKDEDDGDDWLKEESTEIVGSSRNTIPIENDEDVSFSDLEEEDDGDVPTSDKKVTYVSESSSKDS